MGNVKVTVNLPTDTVESLKQLAARRQVTMTEVIRQALANESYIREAVADGARFLVERKGEPVKELVFR